MSFGGTSWSNPGNCWCWRCRYCRFHPPPRRRETRARCPPWSGSRFPPRKGCEQHPLVAGIGDIVVGARIRSYALRVIQAGAPPWSASRRMRGKSEDFVPAEGVLSNAACSENKEAFGFPEVSSDLEFGAGDSRRVVAATQVCCPT